MKNRTPQEKIKILEKAKVLLETGEEEYICFAILLAMGKNETSDAAFRYIPEISKYRPKRVFHKGFCSDVWFAETEKGKLKRMGIIDKVIADINKTQKP